MTRNSWSSHGSEDSRFPVAGVSEWTTRVVALTRWVGAGRKLTQTGRLTLAHARELVELLDTGDVIDPQTGGLSSTGEPVAVTSPSCIRPLQ